MENTITKEDNQLREDILAAMLKHIRRRYKEHALINAECLSVDIKMQFVHEKERIDFEFKTSWRP